MDQSKFVIVGGGMVAGYAAKQLVDLGLTPGELTILSSDSAVPYERPPLSKGYLAGEKTAESTSVQPAAWYADHAVDLRTGSAVTALDLDAHTLSVGGETLAWSRLLLRHGPRRSSLRRFQRC